MVSPLWLSPFHKEILYDLFNTAIYKLMSYMEQENNPFKENERKIIYVLGFIIVLMFLYFLVSNRSCVNSEPGYRYVCSDGSVVDSAALCPIPEPKVIIREINTSCNESQTRVINYTKTIYVCVNGSVVENISQCTTSTTSSSTTSTTQPFNRECVELGCPRETEYVGSKKRGEYYDCKCYISRYMINESDRLCFDSIQAAEAYVYDGNKTLTPCKLCLADD